MSNLDLYRGSLIHAKKGDMLWSKHFGWGRVVSITKEEVFAYGFNCPIVVMFADGLSTDCYNTCGKRMGEEIQSLFLTKQ